MNDTRLKVLVVDDEPEVVHALEVLFDVHGLPCVAAASPDALRDFVLDHLTNRPGVANVETSLIFEHVRSGPDLT